MINKTYIPGDPKVLQHFKKVQFIEKGEKQKSNKMMLMKVHMGTIEINNVHQ